MRLDKSQVDLLNVIINKALAKVYSQDSELVDRGGMERSLSFRFGLYFSELVARYEEFSQYNIDLEYNKNGLEPKRIPRRPNGVQPDFLLHERGSNDNNVLVIEFKGWWNGEDREVDQIKLEDFVSQEGEYKYGIGVLVEFNQDDFSLTYFFDYELEE